MYLKMATNLADLCLERHIYRWKFRPKVHYLDHQISELVFLWNPKFWMCFMDEDFIGKIANLGSKCHAATVASSTLLRYLILLLSRMRRRGVQSNAKL